MVVFRNSKQKFIILKLGLNVCIKALKSFFIKITFFNPDNVKRKTWYYLMYQTYSKSK